MKKRIRNKLAKRKAKYIQFSEMDALLIDGFESIRRQMLTALFVPYAKMHSDVSTVLKAAEMAIHSAES